MGDEDFDREDAEIVGAVQRGETDQFERLVIKYQPRAYRLAHHYLHDHDEAENISQEAFLLAFKHIGGFRGDARFSTWFVRIVINLSLNRIRRRRSSPILEKWKRRSGHSERFTRDEEAAPSRIADRSANPEQRVLNKELGRKIRAAVDALPEKQKTVFLLRHMEGYSIKEICEATQMVEGTVKSYLSRAAMRIQNSVDKYYGK